MPASRRNKYFALHGKRHAEDEYWAYAFDKAKLVMDRGFYSGANINSLLKEHLKFIVAVKVSLSIVRNSLLHLSD